MYTLTVTGSHQPMFCQLAQVELEQLHRKLSVLQILDSSSDKLNVLVEKVVDFQIFCEGNDTQTDKPVYILHSPKQTGKNNKNITSDKIYVLKYMLGFSLTVHYTLGEDFTGRLQTGPRVEHSKHSITIQASTSQSITLMIK